MRRVAGRARGVDPLRASSTATRRSTHALAFGRGLDRARGDRFVGMYVNEATLDYGERGRRGVELFYRRAHAAGLIPGVPRPDFVRG